MREYRHKNQVEVISIKLSFIGTGKMATALIDSILKSNPKTKIIASGRNKENLSKIKSRYNIKTTLNNVEAVKNSDIVFLCVKPQDMDTLLNEIKDHVKNKLIVSIVSGVKISHMELVLDTKRIIKVVPNLNCLVQEMAAGFSVAGGVKKSDIDYVKKVLDSVGISFQLNEKLLDSIVAISGSGVAFFTYFIDAIAQAGIKEGLPKEVAYELTAQVALGTGKLFRDKNLTTEDILKRVTSKNGTTVAGFKVLEKHKTKDRLMEAVFAATKRSKELGK